MKVRLIIAARATAGAMLMAVTLAACTGGSPSASAPSIFTPQPSTPAVSPTITVKAPTVGHSTITVSGPATAPPKSHKAKPKPKPKHTATPTASPSRHRPKPAHSTVPVASPYPTAAPETGGGGTAGLQDGLLFGIGGAAILAGLGSLGYRRRLRRKHRAGISAAPTDTPTHTGIR